jgi:hypothetical protein
MPVAAALVASAAISAYSSNKASKEQAAGIQKGIDSSSALAQQARADVMKLWQQGANQGRAGIEGAFNFYKQAAPKRIAPVTQGFQQGINVLGQGAQQANNAILGLPVDMSFTNQQVQQDPAGYMDGANLAPAQLLGAQDLLAEQPGTGSQVATPKSQNFSDDLDAVSKATNFGGGQFLSLGDKKHFEADTIFNNPLRLKQSTADKINPVKSTKKILKKIF